MDLPPTAELAVVPGSAGDRRPPHEVSRVLGWGAAGFLLLVAGVMAWRRLAGALSSPLEPPAMLLVALATAALATAARAFRRSIPRPRRSVHGDRVLAVSLSLVVFVLGLAVSVAGTPLAAIAVLWSVLVAEEAWGWSWAVLPRGLARSTGDSGTRPRKSSPAAAAVASGGLPAAMPLEQDVTQQLTRVESADGRDALGGWLRVPLPAGQRIGNVHVAFCPPFAYVPRTVVEQVEGPAARVKTVQVLPFGARFEVKLPKPAEESTQVVLRFGAEVPAASPDPAGPRSRGGV